MTVAMAIVDFIPVALFLVGILSLQKDLYNKMSQRLYSLFTAGGFMIVVAGFCKALWKLLYALNVCDFGALSAMFFPMQSIGYLLTGVTLDIMISKKKKKERMYAAAPVAFSGTMVFVGMIVLGALGMCAALAELANKLKKRMGIVLAVLVFFFSMAMGYLSSKDFANPNMHWIAECTNVVAWGLFVAETRLLHKNGLADLTL